MTEQLTMTTKRVDDIPILLAQNDDMGIPGSLDEYFKPHSNCGGTSLGWTTAIWLAHMVSEGDFRMNQVQDCVVLQKIREKCDGREVPPPVQLRGCTKRPGEPVGEDELPWGKCGTIEAHE